MVLRKSAREWWALGWNRFQLAPRFILADGVNPVANPMLQKKLENRSFRLRLSFNSNSLLSLSCLGDVVGHCFSEALEAK